MNKVLLTVGVVVMFIMFNACSVSKSMKSKIYLADSVKFADSIVKIPSAIIQPGDRLSIQVTAPNADAAQQFNIANASTNVTGYLVDSLGFIKFPQLGKIYVMGATTPVVEDTIQKLLEPYIKQTLVVVTINNFKVNVLGEVGAPGTLTVADGNLNILQAISLSGDLSFTARRDNILVIREKDGKRTFGRIDITSNKVFSSPYFYLKQNDFIYVEMDKSRFYDNDGAMSRNMRYFGFAITVLSAALLIVNLVK